MPERIIYAIEHFCNGFPLQNCFFYLLFLSILFSFLCINNQTFEKIKKKEFLLVIDCGINAYFAKHY
ncbi:hypothetical protein M084_3165 [Bacteroides fragilis str. 3988 T1]|nr:hypothetical protein M084_3165 [Bacteroides fragilis str. 3988 T1]RGN99914.1 hypothetical protein DXB33_10280 [Bacteroides fragilis]RGO62552.1 hypothetical protein DXB09_06145 [Bacteroides fragilis]RGY75052.1 hypothetical protein DXA26_07435 [Bacteroides fragilis]